VIDSKDWEDYIFKTGFARLRDSKLIGSSLNQSTERERRCISIQRRFSLRRTNYYCRTKIYPENARERIFRQSILRGWNSFSSENSKRKLLCITIIMTGVAGHVQLLPDACYIGVPAIKNPSPEWTKVPAYFKRL